MPSSKKRRSVERAEKEERPWSIHEFYEGRKRDKLNAPGKGKGKIKEGSQRQSQRTSPTSRSSLSSTQQILCARAAPTVLPKAFTEVSPSLEETPSNQRQREQVLAEMKRRGLMRERSFMKYPTQFRPAIPPTLAIHAHRHISDPLPMMVTEKLGAVKLKIAGESLQTRLPPLKGSIAMQMLKQNHIREPKDGVVEVEMNLNRSRSRPRSSSRRRRSRSRSRTRSRRSRRRSNIISRKCTKAPKWSWTDHEGDREP
jgi:hypothetical protein